MGISIIGLGCLESYDNDKAVFAAALFFRAIQGMSSATLNTTCYTIAANKYSSQTEFVIGMLEAMSGIGLMIGFTGGSYVY